MTDSMRVDLADRRALVTGGGTGIGRAISLGLARCGAAVVVNYSRSEREAEETVAAIRAGGGRALAARADVTEEAEVEGLVATAIAEFGGLEILVANAGGPTGSILTDELTSAEWDVGLDLNCKAVFYCAKHALRRLPDGTGRIIVTSSISGRSGSAPGTITYAAAKGAIYNMVRNWAKECGPRGITVNAIAPGIIWTRIHQRNTDPETYRELIARIPLGRDGKPEDCVGPVLLLASDDGSFITGQTIEVNGGMQMP